MVCIKKIVSAASLLGRLTSYCSSVKWPKASFSLHGSYCGITVQERIVLNPRPSNLRSVFQVRPEVGLNVLFKIHDFFSMKTTKCSQIPILHQLHVSQKYSLSIYTYLYILFLYIYSIYIHTLSIYIYTHYIYMYTHTLKESAT